MGIICLFSEESPRLYSNRAGWNRLGVIGGFDSRAHQWFWSNWWVAKLCFPASVTVRGACLYVAEHPSELQGAIRMSCSLKCLVRFQSTWDLAESMELVSESTSSSDPVHAYSVIKTLVGSLPDIITAADMFKCVITDIRAYTGVVSLDITRGSMASRTEGGFYVVLVNGVQ